jgi:transcription factor IIIB subunit 2
VVVTPSTLVPISQPFMSNTCPSCGSSNPADFDDSSGRLVCTNCGHVINDSFIVSEISFGETSSGAARVQGSYVGEGQTHATGSGGGRFRSGNSLESREQAIMNGLFDLHPRSLLGN